jgi:hypothetical protein
MQKLKIEDASKEISPCGCKYIIYPRQNTSWACHRAPIGQQLQNQIEVQGHINVPQPAAGQAPARSP